MAVDKKKALKGLNSVLSAKAKKDEEKTQEKQQEEEKAKVQSFTPTLKGAAKSSKASTGITKKGDTQKKVTAGAQNVTRNVSNASQGLQGNRTGMETRKTATVSRPTVQPKDITVTQRGTSAAGKMSDRVMYGQQATGPVQADYSGDYVGTNVKYNSDYADYLDSLVGENMYSKRSAKNLREAEAAAQALRNAEATSYTASRLSDPTQREDIDARENESGYVIDDNGMLQMTEQSRADYLRSWNDYVSGSALSGDLQNGSALMSNGDNTQLRRGVYSAYSEDHYGDELPVQMQRPGMTTIGDYYGMTDSGKLSAEHQTKVNNALSIMDRWAFDPSSIESMTEYDQRDLMKALNTYNSYMGTNYTYRDYIQACIDTDEYNMSNLTGDGRTSSLRSAFNTAYDMSDVGSYTDAMFNRYVREGMAGADLGFPMPDGYDAESQQADIDWLKQTTSRTDASGNVVTNAAGESYDEVLRRVAALSGMNVYDMPQAGADEGEWETVNTAFDPDQLTKAQQISNGTYDFGATASGMEDYLESDEYMTASQREAKKDAEVQAVVGRKYGSKIEKAQEDPQSYDYRSENGLNGSTEFGAATSKESILYDYLYGNVDDSTITEMLDVGGNHDTWWKQAYNFIHDHSLGYISDETRQAAISLWNTAGAETAMDYLATSRYFANKEEYREKEGQAYADTQDNGFMSMLGQNVRNSLRNVESAAYGYYNILFGDSDKYGYSNEYDPSYQSVGEKNAVTQASKDMITDWTGGDTNAVGTKLANFLYDALSSGAESTIGMLTQGWMYTINMGAMSYQSSMQNYISQGYDDRSARVNSVIDGVAETLSEVIGADRFLNPEKYLGNGILRYIARSSVAEGAEEIMGEGIKILGALGIKGVNSLTGSDIETIYGRAVCDLMGQGYSYEEAAQMMAMDTASETVYSALTAAASVVLGQGSVTGAMAYAGNVRTGQSINRNNATQLIVDMAASDGFYEELANDKNLPKQLKEKLLAVRDAAERMRAERAENNSTESSEAETQAEELTDEATEEEITEQTQETAAEEELTDEQVQETAAEEDIAEETQETAAEEEMTDEATEEEITEQTQETAAEEELTDEQVQETAAEEEIAEQTQETAAEEELTEDAQDAQTEDEAAPTQEAQDSTPTFTNMELGMLYRRIYDSVGNQYASIIQDNLGMTVRELLTKKLGVRKVNGSMIDAVTQYILDPAAAVSNEQTRAKLSDIMQYQTVREVINEFTGKVQNKMSALNGVASILSDATMSAKQKAKAQARAEAARAGAEIMETAMNDTMDTGVSDEDAQGIADEVREITNEEAEGVTYTDENGSTDVRVNGYKMDRDGKLSVDIGTDESEETTNVPLSSLTLDSETAKTVTGYKAVATAIGNAVRTYMGSEHSSNKGEALAKQEANMNMAMQSVMDSVEDGQDAVKYAKAVGLMYQQGIMGMNEDATVKDMLNTTAAKEAGMTEQQARLAFKHGAAMRSTQNARTNRYAQTRSAGESISVNGTTDISEAKRRVEAKLGSNMDAHQEAVFNASVQMADILGVKGIEFDYSTEADESGKLRSENGMFDMTSGTIRINLNAGAAYQQELNAETFKTGAYYTLHHELTHYLKTVVSPASYQAYTDWMLGTLQKKNGTEWLNRQIRNEMSMLMSMNDARKVDVSDAIDEVIANASQAVFENATAEDYSALARNEGLAAKVKNFITNWFKDKINKLRGLGGNKSGISYRMVEGMRGSMEEASKRWYAMAREATTAISEYHNDAAQKTGQDYTEAAEAAREYAESINDAEAIRVDEATQAEQQAVRESEAAVTTAQENTQKAKEELKQELKAEPKAKAAATRVMEASTNVQRAMEAKIRAEEKLEAITEKLNAEANESNAAELKRLRRNAKAALKRAIDKLTKAEEKLQQIKEEASISRSVDNALDAVENAQTAEELAKLQAEKDSAVLDAKANESDVVYSLKSDAEKAIDDLPAEEAKTVRDVVGRDVYWSRRENAALMTKAERVNERNGYVSDSVMRKASEDRSTVKDLLDRHWEGLGIPDVYDRAAENALVIAEQRIAEMQSEIDEIKAQPLEQRDRERLKELNEAIKPVKAARKSLLKTIKAFNRRILGKTLFSDSSYGGTLENSLICPRSLAAEGFLNQLSEMVGRPLTVEEQDRVGEYIAAHQLEPECTYCYVRMDRMAYREFQGRYLQSRTDVIAEYDRMKRENPDMDAQELRNRVYSKFWKIGTGKVEEEQQTGKKKKKNEFKYIGNSRAWAEIGEGLSSKRPVSTANTLNRFNMWIDIHENGGEMIKDSMIGNLDLLLDDLGDHRDNFKEARDHYGWTGDAESFTDQMEDMLSYAQSASWGKKRVGYREYNGDVLAIKDGKVDTFNANYGLRMYSFSDFHPAYTLENMQMLTDASVKGLKVLAYTKSIDFARIFAPTGANINVSIFGTNFDENGNLMMNDRMGADWAQAQELRKQYPNVGTVLVATNDAQISWAVKQDWIDVVIPYHMVRTGATIADLHEYINYTDQSHDVKQGRLTDKIAESDRFKYGDWKRYIEARGMQWAQFGEADSGHISAADFNNSYSEYAEACMRNHLIPRFYRQWQQMINGEITEEQYMKLVNECRRGIRDSNAVQPVFDVKAAQAAIENAAYTRPLYIPVGGTYEAQNAALNDAADWVMKGTRKEDMPAVPERQFSVKDEIEDGDRLIAVHNLYPEQLLDSINKGGFPAPSIAVVKKKYGNRGFGSCSVLFYKDTVDPEQHGGQNYLWGGDAYTAVYGYLRDAPWIDRDNLDQIAAYLASEDDDFRRNNRRYPFATLNEYKEKRYFDLYNAGADRSRLNGTKNGYENLTEINEFVNKVVNDNPNVEKEKIWEAFNLELKRQQDYAGYTNYEEWKNDPYGIQADTFDLKRQLLEAGVDMEESELQPFVDALWRMYNGARHYFEAKPYRKVGLDEIAAVVIPNLNDNQDLIDALENAGIRYEMYDEGDKDARVEAVNRLADEKDEWQDGEDMGSVQFSMKDMPYSDEQVREARSNWEAERDKLRELEENPEFKAAKAEAKAAPMREKKAKMDVVRRIAGEIRYLEQKEAVSNAFKTFSLMESSNRAYMDEQARIADEEAKRKIKNAEPTARNDAEIRERYAAAQEHFGTTNNPETAGYIMPNGKMLDFSGKHWGGGSYNGRNVDHRDIQEAFDVAYANPSEAMLDFMRDGNIRLMPENAGINLQSVPNAEQTRTLRGYIDHFKGNVIVDVDDVNGKTVQSFTYNKGTSSSRVISDLKAYFKDGTLPAKQSSLAQFRYSLKNTQSTHLDARTMESVGGRNAVDNTLYIEDMADVNDDDAQLMRGFYAMASAALLKRVRAVVHGERVWTDRSFEAAHGGIEGKMGNEAFRDWEVTGIKRNADAFVADIIDRKLFGSWGELEDSLGEFNALQYPSAPYPKNNARNRRLELILHDVLMNGLPMDTQEDEYTVLAEREGIEMTREDRGEINGDPVYREMIREYTGAKPAAENEETSYENTWLTHNAELLSNETEFEMRERNYRNTYGDRVTDAEALAHAAQDLSALNEEQQKLVKQYSKAVAELSRLYEKRDEHLKELRQMEDENDTAGSVYEAQKERVKLLDAQIVERAVKLTRLEGMELMQKAADDQRKKVMDAREREAEKRLKKAQNDANRKIAQERKKAEEWREKYDKVFTELGKELDKAEDALKVSESEAAEYMAKAEKLQAELDGMTTDQDAAAWAEAYETLYRQAETAYYALENELYETEAERDRLKEMHTQAQRRIDTLVSERDQARAAQRTQELASARETRKNAKQTTKDARKLKAELDKMSANYGDAQKQIADMRNKMRSMQKLVRDMRRERSDDIREAVRDTRTAILDQEKRANIRKVIERFNSMLRHPKKNKYVPMNMVKSVVTILESFNDSVHVAAKLGEIKSLYAKYESDPAYPAIFDPNVLQLFNVIHSRMGNKTLAQLTHEEIHAVNQAMNALYHMVRNADRLIALQTREAAHVHAMKMIEETKSAKTMLKGKAGSFLNWQLSPDNFFARISGFRKDSAWSKVQQMFVAGEEDMLRIQREYVNLFADLTDTEDFEKLSSFKANDMVDVGLKDKDGNAVMMTRGMMLSLYMHLEAEDNLRAIARGGLTIPDAKTYYHGDVKGSYYTAGSTRTYGVAQQLELMEKKDTVNVETMIQIEEAKLLRVRENILEMMTENERRMTEQAHLWNDHISRGYLDQVTMDLYGFKKTIDDHYWSIRRNLDFVSTSFDSIKQDITLSGSGFMKERVDSSAPVLMTDFAFEMDRNVQSTSRYCGFVRAERDFNMLYNGKQHGQLTSVKEQLGRVFEASDKKLGVTGQQYMENYIKSIVGGNQTKDSFFAAIRRNLPRGTLAFNFRVALSQVASVPTAAAQLDWQSVTKAIFTGMGTALSTKEKNRIAQENVWFWQRYRGEGGMTEFADAKSGGNAIDRAYNKFASGKIGSHLLNWCQDFDVAATAMLYKATEEWCKSHGYTEGTAEFQEAMETRYRDVLRKTQPMYMTTARSDLMRSDSEMLKMFTMYKTQSSQNFNIMYGALAEYSALKAQLKDGVSGVTREDVAEARNRLLLSTSSIIVAAGTFAAFRCFANLLLRKTKKYLDDDDELTALGILKGIAYEAVSSMASMMVFGDKLFEFFSSIFTGSKFYGFEETTLENLTTMATDLQKLASTDYIGGEDGLNALRQNIATTLNDACNTLGLPYTNVKQVADAGIGWFSQIVNGEGLFENTISRTKSTDMGRLIGAIVNGDTEKIADVTEDLSTGAGNYDAMSKEDLNSGVKERATKEYLAGSLTEDSYVSILTEYAGMSAESAKAQLSKANYEMDTGMKYSQMKDDFMEGKISESDAIGYRIEYGGEGLSTAEDTIGGWRYEMDTGMKASEFKSDVVSGNITHDEAVRYAKEYFGETSENAEAMVTKYEFSRDTGASTISNNELWYQMKYKGMSREYALTYYLAKNPGKTEKDFSKAMKGSKTQKGYAAFWQTIETGNPKDAGKAAKKAGASESSAMSYVNGYYGPIIKAATTEAERSKWIREAAEAIASFTKHTVEEEIEYFSDKY